MGRAEQAPGDLVARPAQTAIPFEHFNGMTGELYFPEMTGQGVALLDYDGDGDLDLYLVQGAALDGGAAGPEVELPTADPPRDVLLRNDLAEGEPRWRDVTERARLRAEGYGMAVATGDVDNDGWVDLLVANYGPNQLWRNRGDGTFENTTAKLQESRSRWTTGAAFVDYDRDGHQDLYLVNYVDYSVVEAPVCYAPSSRQDYCGPSSFQSQPDQLLRNTGDGSFVDATATSGVGALAGSGLGIAVLDVDGDGGQDLYVSNDGQPNFLWRFDQGRAIEDALLVGVAVNRRGEPEASMGVAVGDFDRDGDEDLFVAHLTGESSTLYVNAGGGLFDDRTIEYGLAAPSLPRTAFGVDWVDLEHDGWLDLAVANGAVRLQEDELGSSDPYPLAQANQLFGNRQGTFVEVEASPFAAAAEVSRGLIGGDIDNDGDRDLVVSNSAGPARWFLNTAADGANWLGLSLAHPAHQGVSAQYGRTKLAGRASSAGSYASASDPRVILAGPERPVAVTISQGDKLRRLVQPPQGHYLRFPSDR